MEGEEEENSLQEQWTEREWILRMEQKSDLFFYASFVFLKCLLCDVLLLLFLSWNGSSSASNS